MKTVLITLIMMILAAAGGAYGGYYYANQKASDNQAVLQGDVSNLRLQIQSLQQTQKPSDNDLVIAAVKAGCGADPKVDVSKGSFTVKKVGAPWASVSYNCSADKPLSLAVLEQVGGTWTVIYEGSAAPPNDVITKYGIPKDYQS